MPCTLPCLSTLPNFLLHVHHTDTCIKSDFILLFDLIKNDQQHHNTCTFSVHNSRTEWIWTPGRIIIFGENNIFYRECPSSSIKGSKKWCRTKTQSKKSNEPNVVSGCFCAKTGKVVVHIYQTFWIHPESRPFGKLKVVKNWNACILYMWTLHIV